MKHDVILKLLPIDRIESIYCMFNYTLLKITNSMYIYIYTKKKKELFMRNTLLSGERCIYKIGVGRLKYA